MRARGFLFLYGMALAAAVTASLGACVQGKVAEPPGLSVQRATFSGSYLAGRFAQRQQDWQSAQDYMNEALSFDTGNGQMQQRTFLLALGSGNAERARALAEKMLAAKAGDELALIFMSCDALRRDDFAAALGFLKELPSEGFGQYTKPLLTAWALAGQGKWAEAKKLLADSAAPDDPTYRMHVGLMDEMAGNMNAAAGHYKVAMANGLTMHTAVMVGNFFERYGRPEITHTIYRGLDKIYPFSPFLNVLAARDAARRIEPNISRAADGAALALFDLATVLYEKRSYDSAQIYGGLVRVMSPRSPFVNLMTGDIAALHGQHGKALAEYVAIAPESPIYWLSRLRMAEVYEADGRVDDAVRLLDGLSRDKSMRVPALVSLGDIYRRHDRFEEAVATYNRALEGVTAVTEEHWPIIYARGMAQERLKRWDLAEKDLLQALSFQPDNPMILNFIAYNWANQGVHLEKALSYARQAVLLRPDDGYILDSYGWALFRLGRYQESVTHLEQAVGQIPNDSTLLDHLGDAYWQAGRKSEARHQWRNAHDLSQDPSFKAVVQQKIGHGIVVPSQVARQETGL